MRGNRTYGTNGTYRMGSRHRTSHLCGGDSHLMNCPGYLEGTGARRVAATKDSAAGSAAAAGEADGGHRPPLQLLRRPEVDGYQGETIL